MHQSNIAEMQGVRYTTGMSDALGIYLKTLREGRRLRVNEVLQQLGERLRLGKPADQTRLWRAENGKGWPDGDFLVALLAILQGSLQDVDWLQTHPDATKENAESLAKQRLSVQAQEDALVALSSRVASR